MSAIWPRSGGPFTLVLIVGRNLTRAPVVNFGAGHRALALGISSTLVIALAPPQKSGTVVDVTVTTTSGTSAASSADRFTYK